MNIKIFLFTAVAFVGICATSCSSKIVASDSGSDMSSNSNTVGTPAPGSSNNQKATYSDPDKYQSDVKGGSSKPY